MPKLTGGGINSSVNKSVGVRTGSRTADKVSPRGVSELGYAPGGRIRPGGGHTDKNTALPLIEGQKPSPVMLGNEKALDVGKGGVGTGRTIYKSGYQGTHGPTVPGQPLPDRGDILREFGPDDPMRRGR